jgi:hypothetical protein
MFSNAGICSGFDARAFIGMYGFVDLYKPVVVGWDGVGVDGYEFGEKWVVFGGLPG